MTDTATPILKLGKLPAREGAVRLQLSRYLLPAQLPTPPAEFGHDGSVASWQMLANDTLGDCVIAGGLHETMLWTSIGSSIPPMDDAAAIANYEAIAGYDPDVPSSDRGTDVAHAASYRRRTGLVDAAGHRHKVGAYLALTPGDVQEHLLALYLFGAVGIGIEFPDSAMRQFNQGQPWHPVHGAKIEGGHYISAVARRAGQLVVVTWGREQAMTDSFLTTYNDESYAYLSSEYLRQNRNPEGVDLAALKRDLKALTQA